MPSQVKRIQLLSDIHDNQEAIFKHGTDYDLQLNAGDLTFSGIPSEYQTFFKYQAKPFLWASGNHDNYGDVEKAMGRPKNYYQKVVDVGVFILYFEDQSFDLIE